MTRDLLRKKSVRGMGECPRTDPPIPKSVSQSIECLSAKREPECKSERPLNEEATLLFIAEKEADR